MKFVSILAALAVLGAASYMMAEEPTTTPSEPTSKPKWDHMAAKIVKVDGANVTVMARLKKGEDAKEVVVKTDDKTVVEIDKETAKVADLKPGMRAIVTPREGTAVRIAAWNPKAPATKPAPKNDK